jgi:hypothetical protein
MRENSAPYGKLSGAAAYNERSFLGAALPVWWIESPCSCFSRLIRREMRGALREPAA